MIVVAYSPGILCLGYFIFNGKFVTLIEQKNKRNGKKTNRNSFG